jgi:hypothetical protein
MAELEIVPRNVEHFGVKTLLSLPSVKNRVQEDQRAGMRCIGKS